MPALLLSILTPLFLTSSVSLSYFILAVPMRKGLGKHSCMRSQFSIAILNGNCFLISPGIDFDRLGSVIKLNAIIMSRKQIHICKWRLADEGIGKIE